MTDPLCNHCDVIPAPPAAWQWMRSTFRGHIHGLDGGPGVLARQQTSAFGRMLQTRAGRAVVAVPRGHDEDFLGWALGLDGYVVFAYVRDWCRRQGIGAQLLCALTDEIPIGVGYWTPDAAAMAAARFPIRYEIHAYQALLAFVRSGRTPTGRERERAA
jgi:hypothetical protein